MMLRFVRRPLTWFVAVVLVVAGGIGLSWFQPWKLVTDREVDETLAVVPAPEASALPPASVAAPQPTVVRRGAFISHEHETSGQARVVRKTDGSHVLELVGLA